MPKATPQLSKNTTFQVVVTDKVKFAEKDLELLSERLERLFLTELAKIDTRGDIKATPLPTARGIYGSTLGLLMDTVVGSRDKPK